MNLYTLALIAWAVVFGFAGLAYWSSKHKTFNSGEQMKKYLLFIFLTGCTTKAVCTNPCSDYVVDSIGSHTNVQCCPGQHAETQINAVICRCVKQGVKNG